MTAYIIDTETTSSEHPMEVIELAWIGVEPATADYIGYQSYVERFRPTGQITFGALAAHNILLEELNACRPSVNAKLPDDTEYIIGHKVDFDWSALGCPNVKRICTLAMARVLWPECDSYKLSALTYFLKGASPETRAVVQQAHGALADAMMCRALLQQIIRAAKLTSLEALHTYSEECRIPRIMAFGKHEGKPISQVDRGYANWYRRECAMNEDYPYYMEAFRRAGLVS